MHLQNLPALRLLYLLSLAGIFSCNHPPAGPSKEAIGQMDLKRGNIISCGSSDKQFGVVDFQTSCREDQQAFNLAVALLHSFEYDEAEKAFSAIVDHHPACAMAYWGVAMCNFHPLWTPPSAAELDKGSKAIAIAESITAVPEREGDYIHALAQFYRNWKSTDHRTRCIQYEQAMAALHQQYPNDKEATIFYALALDASASPNDKTYGNQLKAATLLNALYPGQPNHPGIVHYLIHTYDYPGLAQNALTAARRYASVAPSSAHALHMPSHIFTRLGLWDECIQSNLASVAAARCYAEQTAIHGHWDEELHGLDYLVYAYLQKGQNQLARQQLVYADSMQTVSPINFKVAYAFAAIPSRIALENKQWNEAAAVHLRANNFPWKNFPWQECMVRFCRVLGLAHLGKIKEAAAELAVMKQLRDELAAQKDSYKKQQVEIQIQTGEAWLQWAAGKKESGLSTMQLAAAMEDSTEKHPVTPGELLPARELLGDMLLEDRQYEAAFSAYQSVLKRSPNRLNSLYGAGISAAQAGHQQQAVDYYRQLSSIGPEVPERKELVDARKFLSSQH